MVMAAATIKFLYRLALILSVLVTSAAGIVSDTTLVNGANVTDGETVVSVGGSFTLGFFAPTGVPTKRYLGIWFTVSPEVVCWVANCDRPLNDTSGVLVIGSARGLLLLDGSGQTVWSSNTTATSAVTQLFESGNLIVREQSSGSILWQSFDHPSNTLLSGMRLGKNPQTGDEWSLRSWRAPNDPSPGDRRLVLDTKGLPAIFLWQGNVRTYTTGPWIGVRFSGVPEIASYSAMLSVQVVVRPDEVAYVVTAMPGATFSRLVVNSDGTVERLAWDPVSRGWNVWMR